MSYILDLRKLRKAALPVLIFFTAAVCMLGFLGFRYPLKYIDIIKENTELYGLEPAAVCAVIHAESKFAEEALSNKGASGLMQLTKDTAEWTAQRMEMSHYSYDEIFSPEMNIKIGCNYLAWLLNKYGWNLDVAAAAYNAGSGNVDKWLQNPHYSTNGLDLNYIPFKETRNYVKRVKMNVLIYRFILKVFT